jgi:catechol 2,3-dioxygenase-like lactoylglutathione lyase family enzyme
MAVKRIKPNIRSDRFDESRAFYNEVIGLEGGDGLDWILFFGTDKREVQLSVMKLDIKAHVHPDVSIEVDDVDAVYERALAAGAEIVYPITDEDWGAQAVLRARPERGGDQRHGASVSTGGAPVPSLELRESNHARL